MSHICCYPVLGTVLKALDVLTHFILMMAFSGGVYYYPILFVKFLFIYLFNFYRRMVDMQYYISFRIYNIVI